ncbi:MAG: Tad domain-containing protein [Planctomycetes bacterium]|nr:Tad domain-containing protein [Planctomycetota bacterium]
MIRNGVGSGRRPGGIAVPALIAFPVVLMALVVAIVGRQFQDIRVRMQNENDASALAGADVLVSDDFLRGNRLAGSNPAVLAAMYARLQASHAEILNYAFLNKVYSGYAVPTWDPTDPAAGDVRYGVYDRLNDPPFEHRQILNGSNPLTNLHEINSVYVFLRRGTATNNAITIPKMPIVGTGYMDIVTKSAVLLDSDIVGFRPLFDSQVIPLAPIALEASNWETQYTAMPFVDSKSFDPNAGTFSNAADLLPEITITLTVPDPDPAAVPTGAFITIGTAGFSELLVQIANGVLKTQLSAPLFDGSFKLSEDTMFPGTLRLPVPGSQNFDEMNGDDLETSLLALKNAVPNTPRIWPIYSSIAGSNVVVSRFVAARVTDVQRMPMSGDIQSIQFTLQPTMMSVPSALTDRASRGLVGVPNPFIVKARLVP